jgi:hypothetical protein
MWLRGYSTQNVQKQQSISALTACSRLLSVVKHLPSYQLLLLYLNEEISQTENNTIIFTLNALSYSLQLYHNVQYNRFIGKTENYQEVTK